MEKRIALLIDAENTSVKYLDSIFMELRNYGTITYKRMYGDFTNKNLEEWNRQALAYAVVTIQQPRYSAAKNAADIMLVIDAMDILYTKDVDVFCIVSSDSDFTRLVNRLCESGMEVIGMGKSEASKTLKAACTIYKNLEVISGDLGVIEESTEPNNDSLHNDIDVDIEQNIVPLEIIKKSMIEIVRENENHGKRCGLGGLKSNIQRLYKDFDERNYGYSSMTKFINELDDFGVTQEGNSRYVTLNESNCNEASIKKYIIELVKKSPVELGRLGQQIHNNFPGFNVKQYGYSQLGKFIQSIDGLLVENSKKNSKIVKYDSRGEK